MHYSKKFIVMLCLGLSAYQMLSGNCENGDCPYTDIDCAKCCAAGRFVSNECCRRCNCCLYNDQACAECKDYPH